MKKVLVAVVLSLSAVSAFANGPGDRHEDEHGKGFENGKGHQEHGQGKGLGHHKDAVPEIDAAGAGLAIALLSGVVSIARERKKK